MNSRERLLTLLKGRTPDCVPVCPDISNMVPARLTGKPFWEIYVYHNPPLWKAYIDAARYFDIDAGFELYDFGDLFGDTEHRWESRIVHRRKDGSFITQDYCDHCGHWCDTVALHTADNPPVAEIPPEKLGLPPIPSDYETIEGIQQWPVGLELWKLIKKEMGDQGIVGMPSGARTRLIHSTEEIYQYYDNPGIFYERRDEILERVERTMGIIAGLDEKPDFLFCGDSGTLIFQTPAIFRELALPILKRVTELAYNLGIPTHLHSCGPEAELVKIAAEETKLSIIDPLEIRPMGNCDIAQLKNEYGDRLILKGNLHTTDVMLFGSVNDVIAASKRAIDDAARGGRFILSTGDQCGRDTPDDNIHAMVNTARTYGRY